ncbi:MAG: TrbI/VirB10 family protein [Candidatus Omnitrophica bacterium]|nr:TrbI/VirB10 family protein [Candidatus Omnitrophota bacterium]
MSSKKILHLFFKENISGKFTPTYLTLGLVVIFVFGTTSLVKKDNKRIKNKENTKVSVQAIKKEEILDVAIQKEKKKKGFSYMEDFLNEKKPSVRKRSIITKKTLFKDVDAPMVVYDDTKNYKTSMIVPLGSAVKCLLIYNIISNNFNSPVVAQVWEDFYFNEKLLFPFGTRIYGTAAPGKQRDRIVVKFHSAVFQDGKTVNINGLGLSKDGSAGLRGTIVDNRNKKLLVEMATNFLAAFALSMQDTYTSQLTGAKEVMSTSRNAILEGIASTMEKEAQRVQQQILKSDGYAIVVAGSALMVYFEREADVGKI